MTARTLDVAGDAYHALPSLSHSLAVTLLARSPLHARAGRGKAPTKAMDRGTVIHRLVLGAGADYEPLAFYDYRTKAAQTARDQARAAGRVPLLERELDEARAVATNIQARLADRGLELSGESELALGWSEPSPSGPVSCRAMLDHVWRRPGDRNYGRILDLKITANAAPAAIERSAETFGYAIQHAAYTRALAALDPALVGRVEMLFAFCEPEEPYAINVCRPDGVVRELGDRRWRRAVETWGACLAADEWPAYGAGINQFSAPPWAVTREEL